MIKKPTRAQINLAMLSQAPSDVTIPKWATRVPVVREKQRNAHPEADVQVAIVAYLARVHPSILVSASLSGTALKGGMLAMMRAKKAGHLTGLPDLCLICPKGKVIWIEVKSDKGVLSDAQRHIHGKLGGLGHSVFVCRSIDEVKEALKMETIS